MGFPCHITHNATKKATDAFSKTNHFSIEGLVERVIKVFPYLRDYYLFLKIFLWQQITDR